MKLLFLGTQEDKENLPHLKGMVGTATVFLRIDPILTLIEIELYCEKRDITGIISTSSVLLQKLLDREGTVSSPSLANYAGSMFHHKGLEIVFIEPLDLVHKVNYYKFLTKRYISKLVSPTEWKLNIEFKWDMVTSSNTEKYLEKFEGAYAISVDIETTKDPLAIYCVGYTGIFLDTSAGTIHTISLVLPIICMIEVVWMRQFNSLSPAKILQNGKYDIAWMSSWNAPLHNYMWDMINLFHCWYSELPKDLGSLGAFLVRDVKYWKDLGASPDLHTKYLYNAKDTWTTAIGWISIMLEMPQWARDNYLQEFPLVFPCHLAEMTGMKRDFTRLREARSTVLAAISEKKKSLEILTATPGINSNSPKQIKELLIILGCVDIKSTEEKDLKKAALRHPINSRIINTILSIRGNRKLISTYLRTDEDITKTSKKGAKEYHGRILYALNPHGTDTGRLASREHHFWCGLQVQNIPRGESGEPSHTKTTIVADEGFRFAEVDLEQAESRDTAAISGDSALLKAVNCGKDFHSINASAFFGKKYDDIFDEVTGKTKDKKLRDIAKRVNHGANYNMGPGVLIDTMGEDKVSEARGLLGLSKMLSLRQVAEYLLEQFHKTYPGIKNTFYSGVVHEVTITHMLSSKATHEAKYQSTNSGWVRYCFGRPDQNKSDLNAYVAHPPQSLNAATLNKAFMQVFYDIAIHPVHASNFKLCAQIHDSILFQFREGHEYLCKMVQGRMEIPVRILGYDGVSREFTVPAAIKAGKDGKGVAYWSDTE